MFFFLNIGDIDSFLKKLGLYRLDLSTNNLNFFDSCKMINSENLDTEFTEFIVILDDVIEQFKKRFEDFEEIRKLAPIFYNPMKCIIHLQPLCYQLELCELQSDPILQIHDVTGIDFWKLVPIEKYPILRDGVLRIYSMFGSTYLCESTFSIMSHIKSKNRNRLTDDNLQSLLRVTTTNIPIEISEVVDFINNSK